MEKVQHGANQPHLDVCQVEVELPDSFCLGGVDSLEAGEEQLVARTVRLSVGAEQAEGKTTVLTISISPKVLPNLSLPVVCDPISSLESLHLDRAVVVGSATGVHLESKVGIGGQGCVLVWCLSGSVRYLKTRISSSLVLVMVCNISEAEDFFVSDTCHGLYYI